MIELQKQVNQLTRQLKEKDLLLDLKKQEEDALGGSQGGQDVASSQELIELREQLRVEKEKNKILRFKAGQMFLKVISERPQQKQPVRKEQGAYNQENFQDDEAILKMLTALKDNPPLYVERLKSVDKDGDLKVTQSEFIEYCNRLKLTQIDTLSLCRICGFLDGKKLLGIKEFQEILQKRPAQRQASEEKLFQKIIDAFKAKNLNIEQGFKIIDTDGSGELSQAEFRQGLEDLKIVLNEKDFKNLFCLFDLDKNGQISLSELKTTLDEYQSKVNRKQQLIDDFEKQKKNIDMEELWRSENERFMQEGEQLNRQPDKVNGTLNIRVPYVRDISPSYKLTKIFVQITLTGSNEATIRNNLKLDQNNNIYCSLQFNFKNKAMVSALHALVAHAFPLAPHCTSPHS